WLRKDLTHPETQAFAKDVLNHMRERLRDYQEKYGDLYNLEATPAESTTFRLAKHDIKKYPDIITAAKKPGDTPYYTNSSHLPVGYTADVFEALAVQDELQTLYTSGTVFHAFLGEKLPDWRSAATLVRKIAENFKLPYYTLSPTYSICQKHGYIAGEHANCPHCGEKCEIWSRITGYYRPVQNWNDGKVQEFKDRQEYVIEKSVAPEGKAVSTPESPKAESKPSAAMEDGMYLFTTKTCPNCGIAKEALDKAGMVYSVMDVSENLKLARSHAIMQAPTLVVYDHGAMQKFVGASAIAGYIEK
ncbi:MAG: ribonucleoside triphosphate reductase, partial [Oscillospiraceae bacterium]|nr:ribonucleoside triphosphate reductase [Oscillospiraceae bacterium]